jgi:hypothetical protein
MGRPNEMLGVAVAFLTRELQKHPEGVAGPILISEGHEEANIDRRTMYRAADDLGIDRKNAEKVRLSTGREARLWKLTPISESVTEEGEKPAVQANLLSL